MAPNGLPDPESCIRHRNGSALAKARADPVSRLDTSETFDAWRRTVEGWPIRSRQLEQNAISLKHALRHRHSLRARLLGSRDLDPLWTRHEDRGTAGSETFPHGTGRQVEAV